MPVIAQSYVSLDSWELRNSVAELGDVLMDNPLYIVGLVVFAIIVGRIIFKNRQI